MIEFRSKTTGGREFATALFAIWGMGGFGVAGFAAMAAPPLVAVEITLLWIGGVAFFGMAALISPPSYRVDEPGLPVYVAPPDRTEPYVQ